VVAANGAYTEMQLPISADLPANLTRLEVTVTRPATGGAQLAVASAHVRLGGLPTVTRITPEVWSGIGGEAVRIEGDNLRGLGARTTIELSYDNGTRIVALVVGGAVGDDLACELGFAAPMLRFPHTIAAVPSSADRESNVTLRVSTNGGFDYFEPSASSRVSLRVRPKLLVGYVYLEAPADLGWTANWCAGTRARAARGWV
jgi:hypothetical protein